MDDFLKTVSTKKVIVVGDLILDEYLEGIVDRVSPEAPVLIHQFKSTSVNGGGAANVARNISSCGATVVLIGVCGHDDSARLLRNCLESYQNSITLDFIVEYNRATTRKTRIMSTDKQLMRLDREDTTPLDIENQNLIIDKVRKLFIDGFDGLIISDYQKGVVTEYLAKELIKLGKQYQKPIIVDSKSKKYKHFEGADLVTPNKKEALNFLNLTESTSNEEILKKINNNYNFKNILVTLGSEGMIGRSFDGEIVNLKSHKVEVFDVSGAGDTVTSLMALGILCDLSFEQSAKIANLAGSIIVAKKNTQPLTQKELYNIINKLKENTISNLDQKVVSINVLASYIKRLKSNKLKIGFTNGCFDLFHPGHLHILKQSKALCDHLVVGLNSDSSVASLKGPSRPIYSLKERIAILSSLECVDSIVVFDNLTPLELIVKISPDLLIKGEDYRDKIIVGRDEVENNGGKVVLVPLLEGHSTTKLINRFKNFN